MSARHSPGKRAQNNLGREAARPSDRAGLVDQRRAVVNANGAIVETDLEPERVDCGNLNDLVQHRSHSIFHRASMKKQPRQNRDLQSKGEPHHPFEDNEFGIDP
jgi:hypothetical protein